MTPPKNKVLLYATPEAIAQRIGDSLAPIHCEIIATDHISQEITTAAPSLIICGIDRNSDMDSLEDLLKNETIRHIPIMVISEFSGAAFRERLLKQGVSYLLGYPFFKSELQHKCEQVFKQEGRFSGSYTHRFVNAFIDLFGSQKTAHKIVGILKVAGEELEITGQDLSDVLEVGRLLSATIHGASLERIIRFYEKMGFAIPVKNILTDNVDANRYSALAYAALETVSLEENGCGLDYDFGANQDILDTVKAITQLQVLPLTSADDLDFILDQTEKALQKTALDSSVQALFLDYVQRTAMHVIIHHDGGEVTLEDLTLSQTIKIIPNSKQITPFGLQEIANAIEPTHDEITLDHDQYRIYLISAAQKETPSIQATDSMPLQELSMPEEAIESLADITTADDTPVATKSAVEYIAESELEPEDLNALAEIEEDLFEILDSLSYRHDLYQFFPIIGDLLQKYGNALIYQNEFSAIAESLSGLSAALLEKDLSDENPSKIKNIVMIITSLVSNLRKWRYTLFVEQALLDIHFYDNSILADCEQLLAYIFPETHATAEIELF